MVEMVLAADTEYKFREWPKELNSWSNVDYQCQDVIVLQILSSNMNVLNKT